MTHSFRSRTFTLSAVILLLLAATTASSAAQLLQPRTAADKITPWVLDHTQNGAQAEFLVVLADQADLSGAAKLPTKLDKGRYVYKTLFDTAQVTQAPLIDWLKARGVEYRSYYIVNLIWVKADRATALALAARSDVARLDGNPQIKVPLEPLPALLEPASSDAIEPGVTYIHAPDVWALGFTGQGIVVGGQDTGILWNHPALINHYRGWNTTTLTVTHDYNWHDSIHTGGGSCGADSPFPCDDYGHGTHTMGTAVGSDGGANQIGVAPGAKFIGCRNMNVGVGSPATYLECFEFFLAPYPVGGTTGDGDPSKAPDVTNNSWSCPPSEGCNAASLLAAVQAQRAAGIMTVASATNSGPACNTISEPIAIYDEVYTVGALNTGADSIAGFSSRGAVTVDGSNRAKPDIAAPGTSTRSSLRTGDYGSMSGTSMASPHVAGAVALLWSARPELKNQIDATEQFLDKSAVHIDNATCDPLGTTWPNNTYGYGRLDIKAALYGAVVTPITSTQAANPGTTITYTLRVTNTAVTTDSLDMNIGSSEWPVHVVPTSTGSLSPNFGVDVTATVDIPNDAPAYLTDTVTLTFASHAAPTRTTAAVLTTSVRPVYAVALAAPLQSQTVLPGQVVSYSVWLTNTGNITDDLSVSSRGNQWLSAVIPTQVALGPHATTRLTAFVLSPLSATLGESDTLRVTITGTDSAASIALITIEQLFKHYLPMLLR